MGRLHCGTVKQRHRGTEHVQRLKSTVCASLVNDRRVEPRWQRQFGDKERIKNCWVLNMVLQANYRNSETQIPLRSLFPKSFFVFPEDNLLFAEEKLSMNSNNQVDVLCASAEGDRNEYVQVLFL